MHRLLVLHRLRLLVLLLVILLLILLLLMRFQFISTRSGIVCFCVVILLEFLLVYHCGLSKLNLMMILPAVLSAVPLHRRCLAQAFEQHGDDRHDQIHLRNNRHIMFLLYSCWLLAAGCLRIIIGSCMYVSYPPAAPSSSKVVSSLEYRFGKWFRASRIFVTQYVRHYNKTVHV